MIIVIGLFMMMMCPKEKDHKDAICLAINQAVDEKFGESSLSISGIINYGSKFALKKVAWLFIDSNVTVDNYGLLSIGRYTFDSKNSIISVGLFNQVFTISKDDILEEIEKQGL